MWGDTGVGKTFSARRHYGDRLYILRRPEHGDLVRWDGYRQGYHKAVLIDEFKGQIDIATLNTWVDIWPFDARTFGGVEQIRPEVFIINSNRPPGAWWYGVGTGSLEYKALERRWTQAGACTVVGSRENVLEHYELVKRHEADDAREDAKALERLEEACRNNAVINAIMEELERMPKLEPVVEELPFRED